MSEKTNKNVGKTYTDPVTGKFAEGNPGGGRPKGSLGFATKWRKFIEKIAEENDVKPSELDEQLYRVAFKKARGGDYQFYKDIHDRVYGKPLQSVDTHVTGEIDTGTTEFNPNIVALTEKYKQEVKDIIKKEWDEKTR